MAIAKYANKPVIDFFSFQGRARSSASSVGEKRASNASMGEPESTRLGPGARMNVTLFFLVLSLVD